jgi:nicotinate-nucleotide pyrophosphorylase (carboxylating)
VRAGGGSNHRFGLDDAVLIKDNHLAIAGSVEEAVRRARAAVGHLVKVEVEVDDLEQLARRSPVRSTRCCSTTCRRHPAPRGGTGRLAASSPRRRAASPPTPPAPSPRAASTCCPSVGSRTARASLDVALDL